MYSAQGTIHELHRKGQCLEWNIQKDIESAGWVGAETIYETAPLISKKGFVYEYQ